MTHLSLFSGIGTIDLAAHWAGFETVAFCEQNDFCKQVLAKNFPGVPIHNDVRKLDATGFMGLDLVSAGSPCQDNSIANPNGKGIDGPSSGLVFEALRIVGECRPAWFVLENVRQLLNRGLDRICAALEAMDYEVWPLVVAAGSTGAPHIRQRVFVVAHAKSKPGL